ncbi:hypothetical protein, partial [Arcobacter sp.]|uniref:hypothetical protein n=1 Tax=Arcobacter sp. TaxID=1872629 RepID=UPI003C74BA19
MQNKFFLVLITILIVNSSSNAVSLKDTVSTVMIDNPTIQAELQQQKGYSKYVDDREGNYLPTVNLEAYYEKSRDNKDRKSSSTD